MSLFNQGAYWYRCLPTKRDEWFERLITAYDRIVRHHELFSQFFAQQGPVNQPLDEGMAQVSGLSLSPPRGELLKKAFAVHVETCPHCGGRMRPVAVVTGAALIRRATNA